MKMEMHDSEWQHMVSQGLYVLDRKKKAWMGSNFYQKTETY